MRVCITRSERYSYSETFIRDQIAQFSKTDEIYTIHTGRLPERDEHNKLLSSRLFWALHQVIKGITGKRNNFFGNYGVLQFLLKQKIDVVVANYGLTASHMTPICKQANIPLIVIFHGHDATDRRLLAKYSNLYHQLFDYASAIVAVSQDIAQQLISLGANSNKVQVIPCGVDINLFRPIKKNERTKLKFLAVGRFTAKKGPEFTIRAFQYVWLKFPESRLIMVGAHSGLFEKCKTLVATLGLSEAVIFPGAVNHEVIVDFMNDALAFVQHSITASNGDTEGTPVSVLEASASGLPVISTKHGGIKQAVIHDVTGYLVDEKDVVNMSRYMIKLIEEPGLYSSLGKAGREHIKKNYNQEDQVEKVRQLAVSAVSSFHF